MKNFSNRYIFIYSAVLVAVVAVILSVVAMGLRDKQQANVRNEKMQSLLAAINVECSRDEAPDLYKKYFDQELTVGTDGQVVSQYSIADGRLVSGEVRAFDIDLKAEQAREKSGAKGAFPIYSFRTEQASGWVIPTRGNGLWGPVYANVALDADMNSIVGITFSHESETPGLGAEIATRKFQEPFIGKQILDEQGKVVSIAVKKHADPAGAHEVDAISGGTMTSNGVNAMLADDLSRYQAFFDAMRNAARVAMDDSQAESATDQATEEEVSHE